MSPLLGSAGGSSEYAFRGTLDDWPNAFDTVLSAQNLTGQTPGTTVTATLTVGGINYKARLTVDYPNTTVSINGGTPISAKDADPEVFVRDNDVITINFEIPLTSVFSFNTLHVISVKLGKRSGTWSIRTRPIDATPNTFSFTNQPDLELSTLVTSNTVTFSGLEPNFDFDLSVGTGVTYYKNGVISTSSTITNGDTLYLETISPAIFSTLISYTVSAGGISSFGIGGGISTTWTITTRSGDSVPDAFTFTDVLQANDLGGIYTSNPITVSGVDAGPLGPDPSADSTAVPVGINAAAVSIGGGYEIRDSFGNLRYNSVPPGSEYFQNNVIGTYSTTNYAYLGDTIIVRLNSSPNYSTTRDITLDLNGVSDTYSVTTRPTPINTIPSATGFSFTALTDQNRGSNIFSDTITLSGITTGNVGIASITASTPAGIDPRFRVVRGGVEVKAYTAAEPFNVQSGDQITLRMTTPNPPGSDGVITSNMTFRVSGTNTEVNDVDRDGFTTTFGSRPTIWEVTTKARSCGPIVMTTFSNLVGVNAVSQNTLIEQNFTPSGFEPDCGMVAILTSNSSEYNFTGIGNPIVGIAATKRLENITSGVPIRVSTRSSNIFNGIVTTNVQITNEELGKPTPGFTSTSSWTIQTVGNTTPASISFSADPTQQEVDFNVTLSWNATNVISFRSASWTTATFASIGTTSVTMPAAVPLGIVTSFTISFYANPDAENANAGAPDPLPNDAGGYYVEGTVDVTVLNDLTPIFDPSVPPTIFSDPGTPQGNGPTFVTHEPIIVSDISAPILVELQSTLNPLDIFQVNSGAINNADKDVNNGDSITFQQTNNRSYLEGTGTNTAINQQTLLFRNKDTNELIDSVDFLVEANPCVSTSILRQWPSATAPNRFGAYVCEGITYYTDGNSSTRTFNEEDYCLDFPPDSTIGPFSFAGTYGDYILNTDEFDQTPTFGGNPISWRDYLEVVFRLYNKSNWGGPPPNPRSYTRNPLFSELTGTLPLLIASTYFITTPTPTNVTELVDAYIARFAAPGQSDQVDFSQKRSYTTGLIQIGLVFDSCVNPIPVAFPEEIFV